MSDIFSLPPTFPRRPLSIQTFIHAYNKYRSQSRRCYHDTLSDVAKFARCFDVMHRCENWRGYLWISLLYHSNFLAFYPKWFQFQFLLLIYRSQMMLIQEIFRLHLKCRLEWMNLIKAFYCCLSWTGIPTLTSGIPVQCSTSWAITPTGSWSLCGSMKFWVQEKFLY